MPQVSETIPDALAPRVEAAVAWFNASEESAEDEFKVTGILDADEALSGSDELRLIMCGGERCEQRSFRVTGSSDTWAIEFTDTIPTNKVKGHRLSLTHRRAYAPTGSTQRCRNTRSLSCCFTGASGDRLVAPSYGATLTKASSRKSELKEVRFTPLPASHNIWPIKPTSTGDSTSTMSATLIRRFRRPAVSVTGLRSMPTKAI